jgi:hypothetical protein
MKYKKISPLVIIMISTLACSLGSNNLFPTEPEGGIGVPLPPNEDYGVLCFVELEDSIVANAPSFNAFSSQDGGLTWQATSAISGSDCNPGYVLQKELWATPNGLVRYRFEVGHSIEASYDQGISWQLVYDLSDVPWEIEGTPDAEREVIVRPGPLDAMIDPHSGNLLLAMGHAGILLRLSSGEWRWVGAGPYTTTTLPPDPKPIGEDIIEGLFLTSFEKIAPEFELDTETNYVDALVFSPDGKQLATSGFSGGVKLFDFPEGELQYWLQWATASRSRNSRMYGAVFSLDGETLCTCGTNVDQTLNFWDVNTLELINHYQGYQTRAMDTGRFENVQYFAIGFIRQVHIFRLPEGQEFAVMESQLEKSSIGTMRFIPNMNWLALGGAAGGVELWDFVQQEIVFTLQPDHQDDGRKNLYHAVNSLGYDPSGGTLMALLGDGRLHAWHISTGEPAWQLALPIPHGWFINISAFSPDGSLVAVGMHNGTLILFDVQSGKTFTRQWITNGGTLQQLAFSPDGEWLAAGFTTGIVKIWQIAGLLE